MKDKTKKDKDEEKDNNSTPPKEFEMTIVKA